MAQAGPSEVGTLIILILLTIAVGGLLGAGLTELARRAFGDPKLSRLLAGVTAVPSALHVPRFSIRGGARGGNERLSEPEAPDEHDVELAVREHLYGGRGRSV